MPRSPRFCRIRCLYCLILTVTAIGCRPKTEGFERFVPPSPTASRALTTALTGWQNGKALGEVATKDPKAWIIDTHHRKGQGLARFEVLGEIPFERARCFAVRLTFENPDEEVAARFIIFGIDPLWIYRQEDYECFIHCEPSMANPALAEAEPAASEPDGTATEPEPAAPEPKPDPVR